MHNIVMALNNVTGYEPYFGKLKKKGEGGGLNNGHLHHLKSFGLDNL